MDKANLIAGLRRFIVFLEPLRHSPADQLIMPVHGDWSARDIISHIMGWDKNFMKTTAQSIHGKEAVVLEEHADVQAFNDASVEYGRSLAPLDLINEALDVRKKLIDQLEEIDDSIYSERMNKGTYTLAAFLEEMFIEHDLHHMEQMSAN